MKGKRNKTEEKVRILREADSGKGIQAVCQEHNISEVTYHRWKKDLGMMSVPEARRLKDLEKENGELKKMLAEALLAKRVLEAACEKNSKPGASAADGPTGGSGRALLRAGSLSDPAVAAGHVWVSEPTSHAGRGSTSAADAGANGTAPSLWVSADRGAVAPGRVSGGQAPDSAFTPGGGVAGAADEKKTLSARLIHGSAHSGHPSGACLDLGFHCGATVRCGSLRMLTLLDEYTRECHVLWADRALRSSDVLHGLGKAIAEHGAPEYLRSDNGSEFIASEVQNWLAENHIKTIYVDPGSPWQNGFVESFHVRFRDECLNREQHWTLTEARVVIEDFRREYNPFRPHSKLGYASPAHFTAEQKPAPAPVGLRPPSAGAGQGQKAVITSTMAID